MEKKPNRFLGDADANTRNGHEKKRSLDPFEQDQQGNTSAVLKVTEFIQNICGHRGMFWLGCSVAVVAGVSNWLFYLTLFSGVTNPWVAVISATLVNVGTTLFEIFPTLWKRSQRAALHEVFVAASKPNQLPTLNPAIVGDARQLLDTYKNADRNTRRFFETMRYLSFTAEGLLGVILVGGIGSGIAALFSLGLFLFSILGVDWGVSLALKASNWELPPGIQKQLTQLLGNDGKPLTLKTH